MTTTFDDWLRALAAGGKGPISLTGAMRGLAWSAPVELAGDWTGAVLTGAMRSMPDAASVLADFTVSGPVVAGGTSTWTIGLAAGSGAGSTGALPADGDGDGVVYLPFTLILTPSGLDAELLLGGTFTLIGEV